LAEGSTAMSFVLMTCSTVVNVATRLGSAARARLIPITSVKLRSRHREPAPLGEQAV
jgi:NCAIR mutase (PurE)-related protein